MTISERDLSYNFYFYVCRQISEYTATGEPVNGFPCMLTSTGVAVFVLPRPTSDVCSQYKSTPPATSVTMSKVMTIALHRSSVARLFALYRTAVCTVSYGCLHSIVRLFALYRTAICTPSHGHLHSIARLFALCRKVIDTLSLFHSTAICTLSLSYLHATARLFALYRTDRLLALHRTRVCVCVCVCVYPMCTHALAHLELSSWTEICI